MSQYDISQSTKQVLLNVVKKELKELETTRRAIKSLINKHWLKAVPKSLRGQQHFESLNIYRNEMRATKRRIKQLAAISRELKA